MDYIAYVCKDMGAGYGVLFPDLPDVKASGRTLDEARDRAASALGDYLAELADRDETAPEPSSLEEIVGNAGLAGGVAILVAAEAPEKTVRVNITARASQLEEIDRLARVAGMTRSAFLVQVAIREGSLMGRRQTVKD